MKEVKTGITFRGLEVSLELFERETPQHLNTTMFKEVRELAKRERYTGKTVHRTVLSGNFYIYMKEGDYIVKVGSLLIYFYRELRVAEIWECFIKPYRHGGIPVSQEEVNRLTAEALSFAERLIQQRFSPKKILIRREEPVLPSGYAPFARAMGYKSSMLGNYFVKTV